MRDRGSRARRCARRPATASPNSPPPQQLTPRRSSSFSVKLPSLNVTSSPDIPICTARPGRGDHLDHRADGDGHAGGVEHHRWPAAARPAPRPHKHLVREVHNKPSAPIARASSSRAGNRSIISTSAPRSRATTHTAWPIGPAPSTTARSPGRIAARLTARTAIDTGSASAAMRRIVGGSETPGPGCRQPLLQPPVDVDPDQLKPVARVRPLDAARVAVAARAQRVHGNPLPDRQLGPAPSPTATIVGRHLVALHAGELGPAGRLRELAGVEVEVRAAQADRLGRQQHLARPGLARIGGGRATS